MHHWDVDLDYQIRLIFESLYFINTFSNYLLLAKVHNRISLEMDDCKYGKKCLNT